ncbi:MAG: glycerophosphodiester phosphodiesterase family protein [Bacteroidaceae bacterium]
MKKLFIAAVALAWGSMLTDNSGIKAQTAEDNTPVKNIVVYGKDQKVLCTVKSNEVDSIVFTEPAPKADMLDVVFHEDGTAEDISPMKNNVQLVGNTSYTYFSKAYNRYIATFTTSWADNPSGYYHIDFEQNTEFRNKLADGHTLEILVMPNYSGTILNKECKPFSAMQSGGTGFLITTTSGSRQNEFCFLPNITTSGSSTWRWTTSGIVPQPKVYYHVVGVWNKEEGKSYIYVDGELKNTIDAPGEMRFANSGCNWFCIGGDPGSATEATNGWQGNIVLARVYDDPLTQHEVSLLWNEVNVAPDEIEAELVKNVDFISGMGVKAGGTYMVNGEGFAEGDQITLTLITDNSKSYTTSLILLESGVLLNLPGDLESGQYRMTLTRGEKTQELGVTTLNIVEQYPTGMKVIAHRGYWNTAGSAQNSRTSLQKAIDLGCYGSETDVWITSDGQVMVNHDATLGGVRIETSTYEEVKDLTLSNGEKIPMLSDLLDILAGEGNTKLIIEIKTHTDEARGKACVAAVIEMVKNRGLQDKVEYIAFSLNLCKEIVAIDPTAHVAYLNGDQSPAALKALGIMGLDYTAATYRNNPTWASESAANGMTTNVWTINDTATMAEMTNYGINYVTTDNPEEALKVEATYNMQKVEM